MSVALWRITSRSTEFSRSIKRSSLRLISRQIRSNCDDGNDEVNESDGSGETDGVNESEGTDGEVGEESEVGEGDLSLAGLQTDADGNDNDNMNDQYLTYENTGDAPLDLTGWTVEDTSDTTYTFRRSRPIALRPPTRTRTDTRASRERTFD
ncbi:hypothetical protein [Halococcus saccharolyticus]|uniref:hypothetical protein n=1 Tax=Halococcus saccharolyticus TaxID=62319 RepID=UPI00126729B3|nr:hypothetical protein [Halococcus saccharolyticus]